ncbi:MAG: YchF/TatD family DNA exonuclease [Ignavibacteriales bacterium]|nr:MAG: YchF/TatD family DNA exonuclease [Ignavibacteriales bacterium]
MFIDTHAHLFYSNFDGEVDSVIRRAKENLIDYILVPATDLATSKSTIELTKNYDMVYGAVGVHPHDTKDWDDSILNEIEALAANNKIVAIGEIGLDYYYDYSPREKQIHAFRSQIELALKMNLPVIIHNRDSDEDMMKIVTEYCKDGLKAQFHCFNGTMEHVHDLLRMKYFISFTGNITFAKAEELKKIASTVSLNNLLLETDSPFMTPVPHRGKRNEPAYVNLVAEALAEAHNTTVDDIARITSLNAFRLFGIGALPQTSFTYQLGDSLYINVTNRCDSDCKFCHRKSDPFIDGYNLKMTKAEEPPAQHYIEEIGDPTRYKEIVFCGYGEPTIRWDVVKDVAKCVKANGGNTRLNTNGHGSYINKRDITPEFSGVIDVVSISLNSFEPRQYADLMRVETRMFNEMVTFAKNVKRYAGKVVMSVVSLDEVEIEKARKIVEEKIGAEFRVREYF